MLSKGSFEKVTKPLRQKGIQFHNPAYWSIHLILRKLECLFRSILYFQCPGCFNVSEYNQDAFENRGRKGKKIFIYPTRNVFHLHLTWAVFVSLATPKLSPPSKQLNTKPPFNARALLYDRKDSNNRKLLTGLCAWVLIQSQSVCWWEQVAESPLLQYFYPPPTPSPIWSISLLRLLNLNSCLLQASAFATTACLDASIAVWKIQRRHFFIATNFRKNSGPACKYWPWAVVRFHKQSLEQNQ